MPHPRRNGFKNFWRSLTAGRIVCRWQGQTGLRVENPAGAATAVPLQGGYVTRRQETA
jgi:hypothetical protein